MAKQKCGFITNVERCIGCNACVIACKSFYQLDPALNRREVNELEESITGTPSRQYASTACNHCDGPACKKACPVGAYTKEENGIVVHDVNRCIGCQMCTKACPYSVPKYNPKTKKVDKCSLCHERVAEGELPICVASCPMDALEMVDLEKETRANLETAVPGFVDPSITTPNVRFIMPTGCKTIGGEK